METLLHVLLGVCVLCQRATFFPCITSFLRARKMVKTGSCGTLSRVKVLPVLCHLNGSPCKPWNLSWPWFLHLQTGHTYHHFIESLWGYKWDNICKEICKVLYGFDECCIVVIIRVILLPPVSSWPCMDAMCLRRRYDPFTMLVVCIWEVRITAIGKLHTFNADWSREWDHLKYNLAPK